MQADLHPLLVKHTVDPYHRPVVQVANFPRLDTELSPAQLRALSAVLAQAADECEALAQETRSYGPERREYQITAA